jgi:peptide/nickel transport system ATP-binding protein
MQVTPPSSAANPRPHGDNDHAAAPADGETVLDVRNVSVEYASASGAVHAVDNVSFTLGRGRILGLAGESGSGKSTLAYAISRLLRPPAQVTQGQVLYYPRVEGAAATCPARGGCTGARS